MNDLTTNEMLLVIPQLGEIDCTYHEAIDGGVDYGRPSSGFVIYDPDDDGMFEAGYESTFDTGDGWDSMYDEIGMYPTYAAAVKACYDTYMEWREDS